MSFFARAFGRLVKWLKMSKFYSFTVTTNLLIYFFRLFAVVSILK